MFINKILQKCGLILLIILMSACGTSPKTHFYLLSSDREINNNATDSVAIGVWKVKLPDIIDRPEIVTRTGPYTINLADFHRWAGGLGSNVSLLIANELSYNLKTGYVDVSPWSTYRNFDYQVKVHIRDFDGELGGESSLEGAYILLNGKGDKKIVEEIFSFKEKVKGEKYNDLAKAMSLLVVDLSNEISKTILKMEDKVR
ncbi:MAG: hypothetical protein DIZ80_10135 [endosymbiont of Galathealinum brachiosum]|uniref:ABC-type transport auxiliary lipoprotein component domain-containing protein n=1 Tax=endosymbiont of Galathealinum brachiosum TaxID=2200906 RepID=A0A370DCM8_9GAMM|nr:MAG: hypothetical protein DIZ80_10135 [endosymbiont of Galathealinum brachiosum]